MPVHDHKLESSAKTVTTAGELSLNDPAADSLGRDPNGYNDVCRQLAHHLGNQRRTNAEAPMSNSR
jgi:hypothetical protein